MYAFFFFFFKRSSGAKQLTEDALKKKKKSSWTFDLRWLEINSGDTDRLFFKKKIHWLREDADGQMAKDWSASEGTASVKLYTDTLKWVSLKHPEVLQTKLLAPFFPFGPSFNILFFLKKRKLENNDRKRAGRHLKSDDCFKSECCHYATPHAQKIPFLLSWKYLFVFRKCLATSHKALAAAI